MNYFNEKNCLFEILVWCKTNPSPTTNQMYLPDLEYCLMFREKKNWFIELLYKLHILKPKYYELKNTTDITLSDE